MKYTSKTEFQSKLDPEVSYTLRKQSHGRRVEFNLSVAQIYARVQSLQREVSTISEELARASNAAKIAPCTCTEEGHEHNEATGQCLKFGCTCRRPEPDLSIGDWDKMRDVETQITSIIVDELYPARIRWGVREIHGLEIDGQPATVETLIADGPEPLVAEVGIELDRLMNLGTEEIMGFKSPSTSSAQVDGTTSATTAQSADETGTTKTESA